MNAAFGGRLISAAFIRDILPSFPARAVPPPRAARLLDRWRERSDTALGPASSVRMVADVAIVPLLELLGFRIDARREDRERILIQTTCDDVRGPDVVVVPVHTPFGPAWRDLVRTAIASDGRWVYLTDGHRLRVIDGRRPWSRDYCELNLTLVSEADASQLLWTFFRATAITASPPPLLDAIALSARHGAETCRALGTGVLDALTTLLEGLAACGRSGRNRTLPDPAVALDHSLTLVYRLLFLLFAEARALVPLWHPVYRDRYSLDAVLTGLLEGHPPRSLTQAVDAISRLAHAGCRAGELRVNAFNGRLFAPASSSSFERCRVGDTTMARALTALATTRSAPRGTGRRILYRDIDVEQLGAVYERVLDYIPTDAPDRPQLVRGGDARKATGTFYTPREVTAHVVREALEPLVRGRTSDEILSLRVLDPAMGSGAFLVAACRYLSASVEDALVREGRWHQGEITASDRTTLRREIASRCLYGVDLNPTAVQVARLSLWLATLAADRPLSFLDHRLVAGDSLIGASPEDVARQPPGGGRSASRPELLPLFSPDELAPALEGAARVRSQLALEPDVSPSVVHGKARALEALTARGAPLRRWVGLLDLWCAGWFWDGGRRLDRALYSELASHILEGRGTLPASSAAPWLAAVARITSARRFLHWPLTFPEVFFDDRGEPRPDPGFDAVIGNPPWDMVRGDSGDSSERDRRAGDARLLTSFVQGAGIYRVAARAHVNRYQLFVERALQLVRRGGRVGLVLPSGILTDAGAAPLRRHLFERLDIDRVSGLDNRHAIFPIHRSVRFALITGTAGTPTRAIRCRFGLSKPEDLDRDDRDASTPPILLTRALIARISSEEDLAVPELASPTDLRIVEGITARHHALGSRAGWHVAFGRELNATDDRSRFVPCRVGAAHAVVEGKQIDPFRISLEGSRYALGPGEVLPPSADRPRLAYRDVASAGNRLTLIAAIVPAQAVTTHTLFCLKTPLPLADQQVLCALLNSFVANYLVRLRVSTHVTASLMSRLVVPVVARDHSSHATLLALSRELLKTDAPEQQEAYGAMQALVARMYGLTEAEFAHILGTFPLISADIRETALRLFARHSPSSSHRVTGTQRSDGF